MVDWGTTKFKSQYDAARTTIASAAGFADEWSGTITKAQRLMAAGGFATADAAALDEIRTKSVKAGGKAVSVDEGFLAAAKAAGNNPPTLPDDVKERAAALKFLSHNYLVDVSGSRTMWVHSAPMAFKDWETPYLKTFGSSTGEVKRLLKSNNEIFDSKAKQNLAAAAKESLAWCQKANAVLSTAGNSDAATAAPALTVFRRWFSDATTTDVQLKAYIASLALGFKNITATLNKGTMLLTDYLPLRGATAGSDLGFLQAEAFTFRNRSEGLDVVYIEQNFLVDNPGNVIKGSRNWTRILVHELTHLVAGTVDVKTGGNPRYAWYGIKPNATFPASDAATNADNWAFFCADAAGALTDAERNLALTDV